MSTASPQFMFDVGSPNAFLSHEAIPAIEKRCKAKFEYIPILLGGIFKATNNRPRKHWPASRTSASFTRWRPSGL
jgi:2-hydroxychromene-2-carboxylate isomerase